MITIISRSPDISLHNKSLPNIEFITVQDDFKPSSFISVLEKIKGDYALFLNHGDTLINIKSISDSESDDDIIIFDYIKKSSQGVNEFCKSNTYHATPIEIAKNVLIGKYDYNLSNKLIRVSLLKEVYKTFSLKTEKGSCDRLLFIKLLLASKSVKYINHAIVQRFNQTNDSVKQNDKKIESLKELQEIFPEAKKFFPSEFQFFIEDYIFKAKKNAVKEGLLNKLHFNKILPLPLSALKRNAWSFDSKIKLILVFFLNKIF